MSQRTKQRKQSTTYGIDLEGVVRIFRKDRFITVQGEEVAISDFWFNVSRKKGEGEYDNKSLNVYFSRDSEVPENNELITLKGHFMLNGEGEYQKIVVYAKEWDYVN